MNVYSAGKLILRLENPGMSFYIVFLFKPYKKKIVVAKERIAYNVRAKNNYKK